MSASEVPAGLAPAEILPRYVLSLARGEPDLRAAQRLRHQVFVEEGAACLDSPLPGHDDDGFDEHCDHLLAREVGTGTLAATSRLLPPRGAAAAGRLVAEADFDLCGHTWFHGDLVEISRACLHPDHRGGVLVPLMTLGVARYALRSGCAWIGGNCLVPLGEHGEVAAAVWQMVSPQHLAPEEYRVRARRPLRPEGVTAPPTPSLIPPLVRGALSLGAWVCSDLGYSPRFRTAALYLLMSMRRADPAQLRHLPGLSGP
ncbi:GNAT family N-acyltransferase [Streptomyces olivoreticuli]